MQHLIAGRATEDERGGGVAAVNISGWTYMHHLSGSARRMCVERTG